MNSFPSTNKYKKKWRKEKKNDDRTIEMVKIVFQCSHRRIVGCITNSADDSKSLRKRASQMELSRIYITWINTYEFLPLISSCGSWCFFTHIPHSEAHTHTLSFVGLFSFTLHCLCLFSFLFIYIQFFLFFFLFHFSMLRIFHRIVCIRVDASLQIHCISLLFKSQIIIGILLFPQYFLFFSCFLFVFEFFILWNES